MTAKVELQIEIQEMCVDVSCDTANGGLGDGRKDCVAEFLEEGCAYSSDAIWSKMN